MERGRVVYCAQRSRFKGVTWNCLINRFNIPVEFLPDFFVILMMFGCTKGHLVLAKLKNRLSICWLTSEWVVGNDIKSSTWVVNHVVQLVWPNAKNHFKRFLNDCTYKGKLPFLVEPTNTNISISRFITKLQQWAILLESGFSSIHLHGWRVESSAFTPSTNFWYNKKV